MNVRLRAYQAITIIAFGPIYLTAVLVFGILEGRTGIVDVTTEFRAIIPAPIPETVSDHDRN